MSKRTQNGSRDDEKQWWRYRLKNTTWNNSHVRWTGVCAGRRKRWISDRSQNYYKESQVKEMYLREYESRNTCYMYCLNGGKMKVYTHEDYLLPASLCFQVFLLLCQHQHSLLVLLLFLLLLPLLLLSTSYTDSTVTTITITPTSTSSSSSSASSNARPWILTLNHVMWEGKLMCRKTKAWIS